MIQSVDHVALLPAYLAAGTAVLALLTDLALARRAAVLAVTAAGAAATAAGALLVGRGPDRGTFCVEGTGDVPRACSYVADHTGALVAVLFGLLTLGVLALSVGAVRSLPAGEYCFLLACSMTGGVVLAYSRDLITLIVALETLTLPLFLLVAMGRRRVGAGPDPGAGPGPAGGADAGSGRAGADGAVTFFVVSVVATAVTLLGAALLYAATGAVHLDHLAARLGSGGGPVPGTAALATAGAVLLVSGLAFKLAAVPFHAWAPAAYDGAPLPVAAYLSTASKLGGVVALLYVVVTGLRPALDVAGPALAALAVLTMTVGNLVALRQRRMVRLLAWSSVAQAGYILAPLGGFAVASGRAGDALTVAVAATVAYTIFYVLMELAAFGAVVALRPAGGDGGAIADYRGVARHARWTGAAFVLALVGLAGLPPGLAGLFAKVVVVRSLLGGGAGWLAVVVALNAVVGLAYYVRVAAALYAPPAAGIGASPGAVLGIGTSPEGRAAGGRPPGGRPAVPWAVAVALAAATVAAVVVGFAPQLVLDAAALVGAR